MNNSTKPSIKINYLYNLAYRILTLIIPLVTAPYISRVLGANNIGIYSFTNANVSYFVLFGVFGLSSYSQFEVAKRRDNFKELNQFCVESAITRIVLMGISITAYIIIYIILGGKYKLYYAILIFSLLTNMLDFSWICEGLEQYKVITIRNFFVKLISVVSVFLFVKKSDDLVWYFVIISSSALVGSISIIPYIKKYLNLKSITHIRVFSHIKASLFFFLPSVASTITSSADKLMIGWFSVETVQNGYYEQATKIENMIFMLFSTLYLTMRPRMAYLYKINDLEKIRKYQQKSISTICFIALPVCVGLVQIADVFVPCFFGPGYDEVVGLLRIMAGWIFIKSISNCLLEQSIVAKGDMFTASKIIWLGTIMNVALNLLLIKKYYAFGAAVASFITELIMLIFVLRHINIAYAFKKEPNDLIKELFATVMMVIITTLIKNVFLCSTVCVVMMLGMGIMVYLGTTFLLKDSNIKELALSIKNRFGTIKH